LDVENYPCWHFDLTTISLAFVETRREKLKKKKRKGLLGCVSTREREREKERERERERVSQPSTRHRVYYWLRGIGTRASLGKSGKKVG
jgi:hypothetical protein